MRSVPKPPTPLHLPAEDAKTSVGEWRSWESSALVTTSFKRELAIWAVKNQGSRCAYCSLELSSNVRRSKSLDHFVPKEMHPRWTFEPVNLLASCHDCNSIFKKRHNPVKFPPGANPDEIPYEDCSFDILHPYLDDVSAHISGGFLGAGAPPKIVRALTTRGFETVNVFRLDSPGLLWTWMGEAALAIHDIRVSAVPNGVASLAELRLETSGHVF
jgi:uncharacterized protein (TIGR02646 family)